MPQILVVTESPVEDSAVVYWERISAADLESAHFSGQLVERVAWAVEDADIFEREAAQADEREADRRAWTSPAELGGSWLRHRESGQCEERRDDAEPGRRRRGDGGDARPRLVDVSGKDQGEREVLEKIGDSGDRA